MTQPVDTASLKQRLTEAQCQRTDRSAALAYDDLVAELRRALDELEQLRALLPKV